PIAAVVGRVIDGQGSVVACGGVVGNVDRTLDVADAAGGIADIDVVLSRTMDRYRRRRLRVLDIDGVAAAAGIEHQALKRTAVNDVVARIGPSDPVGGRYARIIRERVAERGCIPLVMKNDLAAGVSDLERQVRMNAVERVGAIADIERVVAETTDENIR